MPFKLRFLFLCALLGSCTQETPEVVVLSGEKDVIPEGIAIYEGNIFLSSIHKDKIVQYDKSNKATDFIRSGEFEFKSGIGLFAKDDLLFALTNKLTLDPLSSSLFVFDISKHELVKRISWTDSSGHLLNDLTISKTNQIFVTDTDQNKVYKIDYSDGEIKEFASDSTLFAPNGIDLSDDNQRLFVASTTFGLRIIDLSTGRIVNPISPETTGIDGMKYIDHKIYAIVNGDRDPKKRGLIMIQLSEQDDRIERVEPILMGHPMMDVPTTLAIYEGYLYLLANSQMDNLNQETNEIRNPSKLTDTHIIKIKLK